MSQMKQLYDSAASPFEGVPAAQSTKPGLNLNAETFVPEHGYFPPPHGTPETWLEHLDAGMLSSDPKLPPLLVHSCSWTSNTLCDLAQLFCWEILAKANIVDFGPQAACFAREVYNTLANNHSDSEWLSSSFAFHLQQHAFKHFKSIWCSQENPNAISQGQILDNIRWNVALDFSCFIADLFSFGLVKTSTMHHCLGILLREMVSVQHVRVIQAMVKRAGPTLWQTADSHQRRHEFTQYFVQRTRSLPDDASLTERKDSIRKVIEADNIIPLISAWLAQRPECPPPAEKSIWGLAGLK